MTSQNINFFTLTQCFIAIQFLSNQSAFKEGLVPSTRPAIKHLKWHKNCQGRITVTKKV